jgi:hypothetical protein
VAPVPALAVPPGFLPRAATTTGPPAITDGSPPRTWPASPVIYVWREVGAGAIGTHAASRATLSREVGARAAGTRGAPGATLHWEVGAGAPGTRGAPGAALRREVGSEATGTCGALGAALSQEVGAGATGTRGTPKAALSREVGTEALGTRGTPGAALRREVGTGAPGTRGAPGAAPPPLSRPSVRGQGVVVPVMPPDNPHWMITRGKTGFRVVPDHLVTGGYEEEYGALISNGTWELVPRPQGSNVVTGKWVFTHKLCADGTLDHYKSRWVLRGFSQRPGVNYVETFSLVVKPATFCTVLATVVSYA